LQQRARNAAQKNKKIALKKIPLSRTPRTNSAFLSIAELTRLLEDFIPIGIGMKNPDTESGLSALVAGTGIEPVTSGL
jgi:hypothetical protein